MRFQRILQIPLFLLFLLLLWRAAYPPPPWLEVDLFLRLDPLLCLGTMAAARVWIPGLAWGFLVLGLCLVLGRFFCGYVCPLGATVDFADRLIRGKKRGGAGNSFEVSGRHRHLKYLFLIFTAGTSLAGVTSLFLFSPLAITTRFFSFAVYPPAVMLANLVLELLRPVSGLAGLEGLSFVHFNVPSFSANVVTAALVAAILGLGAIAPRFWCRNLCPAGALMALCSLKPLLTLRRRLPCWRLSALFMARLSPSRRKM